MEIAPFSPAPLLPDGSEQAPSPIEVLQRQSRIEQLNQAERQQAESSSAEPLGQPQSDQPNRLPGGINPAIEGFNTGIRDLAQLNERANVIDDIGLFSELQSSRSFDFADSLQQREFVPGFDIDNQPVANTEADNLENADSELIFESEDSFESLISEQQQLDNFQVVNSSATVQGLVDDPLLNGVDAFDTQQFVGQLQAQSEIERQQNNQLLANLQPAYEQLDFTIDQLS